VKDEAYCQQLVATAVRQLGGLDILANIAGKQQEVPNIAELTTEQFDETFKTNVYALFWVCKAALPHMPAGSTIINTTTGERRSADQEAGAVRGADAAGSLDIVRPEAEHLSE
jgi:NAD(P)-dependent dehydrogenase (short-subunit alcohol dehydrogenase family)